MEASKVKELGQDQTDGNWKNHDSSPESLALDFVPVTTTVRLYLEHSAPSLPPAPQSYSELSLVFCQVSAQMTVP